jgi:hypothetical protein
VGFDDSAWPSVDAQPSAINGNANVYFNGTTLVNNAVTNFPPVMRLISDSTNTFTTGAISLRWTFNLSSSPVSEPQFGFWWPFNAGSLVGAFSVWINGVVVATPLNPVAYLTKFQKLLPGKNVIAVQASPPWNTSPRAMGLRLLWQGAGSQQLPTDCCTLTTALLEQILTGVQRAVAQITLVQRQAVPFDYVTSTTHTGLSGAGAISISGLLGIKINLTTLPLSYGVEGTSPPLHFDLGFVTFGTVDGFGQAVRVDRNPQVILPPRCSAFTDLDYDLAPGVVATITELVRAP